MHLDARIDKLPWARGNPEGERGEEWVVRGRSERVAMPTRARGCLKDTESGQI